MDDNGFLSVVIFLNSIWRTHTEHSGVTSYASGILGKDFRMGINSKCELFCTLNVFVDQRVNKVYKHQKTYISYSLSVILQPISCWYNRVILLCSSNITLTRPLHARIIYVLVVVRIPHPSPNPLWAKYEKWKSRNRKRNRPLETAPHQFM